MCTGLRIYRIDSGGLVDASPLSNCSHMDCVITPSRSDTSRMRHMMCALISLSCSVLAVAPAEAGRKDCFVPGEYSETNIQVEVDHQSELCKAFRRELNATCSGRIPTVDFKPQLKESDLESPKWEAIALYNTDGTENKSQFSRLRELAYAKAFSSYFRDKESLANRDATSTLNAVRAAHAAGRVAVFEKVNLVFAGADKPEVIYRLFANGTHNPAKLGDALLVKPEPTLFLERAVRLAASGPPIAGGGLAAGADLTGQIADVLLFKGEPFLMTWTNLPRGVLVYSPNVAPVHLESGELSKSQTMFVLYERCVFDFKSQGK
jgi:hypothetical protein